MAEYALILILVAFVIVALILMGSGASREPLSDVRVPYGPESWHPTQLSPDAIQIDSAPIEILPGECVDLAVPYGKSVKAGTLYENPETINIFYVGGLSRISICNSTTDAVIHVYISYVDAPR